MNGKSRNRSRGKDNNKNQSIMKKYVVIQVFKYTSNNVVFESDVRENAEKYKEVMQSEHPDWKYVLAVVEE